MRTTFDMVAGDQTDALVLSSPQFYSISSVKLSGIGPAYSWTLYFAPAAAAAPIDIVVVDSGDVPETVVAPHTGIQVVSVALDCLQFLVPTDVNGVAMDLFVSTSGKVGTGRLRIVWDGVGPFQGNAL
jgi:hypothetical protein